MKLYDLGHVPWLDSQLLYHALPRLGQEGLILLAPAEPYVCIGYHQDAGQEVDLAYCRAQGIPVFRREVGGGAVYLDGRQLFYQLILHRDNPLVPGDKAGFYQKFLAPVVGAYGDLGLVVHFRPVNDIVTAQGRKISGNGVAEIGEYVVLVGNLIADFDYETMARVLRVPDLKFRDKVFKSLRENLTTLRRELGEVPPWAALRAALVSNFEMVLGPLVPAPLPEALQQQAAALAPTYTSEEWLLRPRRQTDQGRRVKIAAGVEVAQYQHKAPGGLIRGTVERLEGRIVSVEISGDFFLYPAARLPDLERHLVGARTEQVAEMVDVFYQAQGIESPGVTPQDLARALGAGG